MKDNNISTKLSLISAIFLMFVMVVDIVFRFFYMLIMILGKAMYLNSSDGFYDILIFFLEAVFIIALPVLRIVCQFKKRNFISLIASSIIQLSIYVYFLVNAIIQKITGLMFGGCSALFYLINENLILQLLMIPILLVITIIMIVIIIIQVKELMQQGNGNYD